MATENTKVMNVAGGEIVLYQPDASIKLEVRLDPDTQTVWLTQAQMGQLYGKAKSTISEHLTHIFEEGELDQQVVVRESRTTSPHGAIEGKTQDNVTRFYNLDAILAVGFRVRSKQGTLFRQWAIERLRNYIVKGFDIDSDRLKGRTPSRISDLPKRCSIVRFLTSMLPALTIMPLIRRLSYSSRLCRTSFITFQPGRCREGVYGTHHIPWHSSHSI